MLNNPKSQSGFTLVEMMVIAGVISVLAIGFAAYLFQQTKQLRVGQSRENTNQLQINILSSSGKSDILSQSENLQIKDHGKTVIPCGFPCKVQVNPNTGVMGCYYKSPSSAVGGSPVCVTIPSECQYLDVGC